MQERIADGGAVPVLAAAARAPDVALQRPAAAALANLCAEAGAALRVAATPGGLDLLADLADSPDPTVQASLQHCLSTFSFSKDSPAAVLIKQWSIRAVCLAL